MSEIESGTMDPYTVQAEYSFQGENNDELRFKKGDIITVTQREDGGWWEGTLGEMTGWFPSNYVKEFKGTVQMGNQYTKFPLKTDLMYISFQLHCQWSRPCERQKRLKHPDWSCSTIYWKVKKLMSPKFVDY